MTNESMETDKDKPMYSLIIDDIKTQIKSGGLKPDEKLPSEVALAVIHGVSRITSKRALEELEREGFISRKKGSGSYVSSDWQKSVEPIMNSGVTRHMIDIVLPFDSSQGRIIDLIQGANEYLQSTGHFLNILNSEHDTAKEKEILIGLHKAGVAGVIYYPVSGAGNIELLQMLRVNGFPMVTVDKYYEGLPIDSVVSDNYQGSLQATSDLIRKGHEQIAFISDIGLDAATSVRDRFYGYCQAHKDHKMEIRYENFILDYKADIEKNHADLVQLFYRNVKTTTKPVMQYFQKMLAGLLDRQNKVTAIQTANDYIAMYILKTALHMGVTIPDELSIIGFDNIEIGQYLEVPLTTVAQDFRLMGQSAAQLLVKRMSGDQSEAQKVVVPTSMISRQTVAQR